MEQERKESKFLKSLLFCRFIEPTTQETFVQLDQEDGSDPALSPQEGYPQQNFIFLFYLCLL
jgi:hypothetical protein